MALSGSDNDNGAKILDSDQGEDENHIRAGASVIVMEN